MVSIIRKHIKKSRLIRRIYFGLKKADFPPEVWIENTNLCNAHCVMCPREKLTRPKGFMKFELYERLIREVARHKDTAQRVHMHNYGEPLLDRELPARIKLAKDLGIKHLYFVTNASLLTPGLSEDIIKAGLDEFKVSFYGTDRDSYNNTMKRLDFDETLSNIREFFRIRDKMGSVKPRVVIQYLPQNNDGEGSIRRFESIFDPIINTAIGDSLNVFSLHNFGGGRDFHECKGRPITGVCNYAWRTTVILQDGKVVICCLDSNGLQVVGDVHENTIHEIWNGEVYRTVRNDFLNMRYDNYPACMKCDVIR